MRHGLGMGLGGGLGLGKLGVLPPGAPTIGTATAGNAEATVTWTAPASSGGAAITGYRITASTGQTATVGNVTSGTITGLTNGVAVTLTVAAFNGAYGPESAASNSVTPAALGIANGTFDDASGWTLGTGWSISGGKLVASAVDTVSYAETSFSGWATDTLYRLRVTVDAISAGELKISLVGASLVETPRRHTTGTGTIDFLVHTDATAAGATPKLRVYNTSGTLSCTLDNIVVSQDVVIGAEQYADPGFDTPASWSAGTGWTVSGSAANGSSASSGCTTATAFAPTTGNYYLLECVVASRTAGSFRPYNNGLNIDNDVNISTTGTFRRLAYCGAGGSGGGLSGSSFSGSVSSLSLKTVT